MSKRHRRVRLVVDNSRRLPLRHLDQISKADAPVRLSDNRRHRVVRRSDFASRDPTYGAYGAIYPRREVFEAQTIVLEILRERHATHFALNANLRQVENSVQRYCRFSDAPQTEQMPSETIRIPNQLRRLRKERGMSQEELAAKVGVAVSTISRIETGTVPQARAFAQVLALFEVSPAEFFATEHEAKGFELAALLSTFTDSEAAMLERMIASARDAQKTA